MAGPGGEAVKVTAPKDRAEALAKLVALYEVDPGGWQSPYPKLGDAGSVSRYVAVIDTEFGPDLRPGIEDPWDAVEETERMREVDDLIFGIETEAFVDLDEWIAYRRYRGWWKFFPMPD